MDLDKKRHKDTNNWSLRKTRLKFDKWREKLRKMPEMHQNSIFEY